MMGSFTKYPSIWSQRNLWVHAGHIVKVPIKVATGYIVKELPSFFHNFAQNVSYYKPEPLIESSFKMCLAMWPQSIHPYTQQILWEFVVKFNHIESSL